MLDLEFFLANAGSLIPVYLSPMNRTIFETNLCNSLTLSPASFTINAPQSDYFSNRVSGGKGLLLLDLANDFEIHECLSSHLTGNRPANIRYIVFLAVSLRSQID